MLLHPYTAKTLREGGAYPASYRIEGPDRVKDALDWCMYMHSHPLLKNEKMAVILDCKDPPPVFENAEVSGRPAGFKTGLLPYSTIDMGIVVSAVSIVAALGYKAVSVFNGRS